MEGNTAVTRTSPEHVELMGRDERTEDNMAATHPSSVGNERMESDENVEGNETVESNERVESNNAVTQPSRERVARMERSTAATRMDAETDTPTLLARLLVWARIDALEGLDQ